MSFSFTTGQKVWFTQPMFHKGQGVVNGEVTKVGNKYVYVKGPFREFKFDRKTLREVSDSNYQGRLYLSDEEYYHETELSNNIQKIKAVFNNPTVSLTLEQTREILRIMKNG